MKKFGAYFIMISMLLVLMCPMFAAAQTGGTQNPIPPTGGVQYPESQPEQSFTLQNPLKVDSIGGLIQNFVEIFSYIAVLIGVIVLIYIGFKYILYSAQGNHKGIQDMHSWLLWAVVGIALVIAARVIVDVVINTLSATNAVNPDIIQNARNAASGH